MQNMTNIRSIYIPETTGFIESNDSLERFFDYLDKDECHIYCTSIKLGSFYFVFQVKRDNSFTK